MNIKEFFNEPIDDDIALWKIAVSLGIVEAPEINNPDDYRSFKYNKSLFVTNNIIGNRLSEILELLIKLNFLEMTGESQFVWNKSFDLEKERLISGRFEVIGGWINPIDGININGNMIEGHIGFHNDNYLILNLDNQITKLKIKSINWLERNQEGAYFLSLSFFDQTNHKEPKAINIEQQIAIISNY
jgi:hypothetical protein